MRPHMHTYSYAKELLKRQDDQKVDNLLASLVTWAAGSEATQAHP